MIDPDNMPEAMKWWLEQCSGQIVSASQSSSGEPDASLQETDYQPIAPLLTCLWNQDYPYYLKCPVYNDTHAYTGCQITATAQVMYFHKWPKESSCVLKYSYGGSYYSYNLAANPFDWDNMLDTYVDDPATAHQYQNETQENAVAQLMFAVGVGNQAQWGTSGSPANALLTTKLLINSFGYDGESINMIMRDHFDSKTWTDIIYNELRENGPILLEGASASMSHAFVCDGYSHDGYFHINWGWAGLSNGYFLLHGLTPQSQGIGGSSGGSYNESLRATIGIRPPKADAERSVYVCLTADFMTAKDTYDTSEDDGEYVQFLPNNSMYGKFSTRVTLPINYRTGVKLVAEDGTEKYIWGYTNTLGTYDESYYCGECGWGPGAYYIPKSEFPKEGTYTVTPVVLYNDKVLKVYVSPGRVSQAKLVASGNTLTFTADSELPSLEIMEVKQKNDFIAGETCVFDVTVRNNGSEYLGYVQPKLRNSLGQNGAGQLKARYITLDKGEEITLTFSSSFSNVAAGEYTMYFTDAAANGREAILSGVELPVTFLGDVTLDLRLNSFEFENATGTSQVSGHTASNISRDFTAKADFTSNYSYNYRIYTLFYNMSGSQVDNLLTTTIIDKDGGTKLSLAKELSSSMTPGQFYYIQFLYRKSTGTKSYYVYDKSGSIPSYYIYLNEDSSGITAIEADKECGVYPNPARATTTVTASSPITGITLYSISGNVALQCGGNGDSSMDIDVSNLPTGHYIVKIDTAEGTRMTRLMKD